MNRSERLPVALYLIAVLALMLLPFAANAQENPACQATVASNLKELTRLNITADKILVVDDIAFINDYTQAVGRPIPDGSAPVKIMLVEIGEQVYIGLVEPTGCILFQTRVTMDKHVMALKAATSGV